MAEILGYLLVAAVVAAIAFARKPHTPNPRIDALVESALLDGEFDGLMAAACDAEKKSETPLFDLTAAHIAAQLSVNLDAEWERVSRG